QHRRVGLGERRFGRGAPGRVGGELLMRGPQQGGRAEAEDENRNTQRDCGEQETNSGEHFWVRFRHRKFGLRGPWSQNGNAVTTVCGWAPFAAANQAWFDHTASAVQRLLKFVAAKGVQRANSVFGAERGFTATALKEHHNFRKLGARGAELS